MRAYEGFNAYFGDLHNHCGISYGHGSLDDALANARQQLDFCSVTGHAHWPDMPEPRPEFQYIVDFHIEGFAKLKAGWDEVVRKLRAANDDERFLTFPGFEMHCGATGDVTVVYRDFDGKIVYADDAPDLRRRLGELRARGVESLVMPHHIAYPRGFRGIDWDDFDAGFSPVVEIVSMHGCSETGEGPRPFLRQMGPADGPNTMRAGLARGRVFGVVGGTDHHSAHPGSYGHGATGLWAEGLTRRAVWDALWARRTYALTGDRMDLRFSIDEAPMGAVLPATNEARWIEVAVAAGGAIDAVDIIKNGRLLRRHSQTDVLPAKTENDDGLERTLLVLELGWGKYGRPTEWDVRFGVSDGRVARAEPRFRGLDIVAPFDKDDAFEVPLHNSTWRLDGERGVAFETVTTGNPNWATNASQGFCLEVEAPPGAAVVADLNGRRVEVPLARLREGPYGRLMGPTDSSAFQLHRAPRPEEYQWAFAFEDAAGEETGPGGHDSYYVRVRQKNDQWAWSSPIFIRRDR